MCIHTCLHIPTLPPEVGGMHVSYFHEHLLTFVGLLTQVHRLRVPEERPTLECIWNGDVVLRRLVRGVQS